MKKTGEKTLQKVSKSSYENLVCNGILKNLLFHSFSSYLVHCSSTPWSVVRCGGGQLECIKYFLSQTTNVTSSPPHSWP